MKLKISFATIILFFLIGITSFSFRLKEEDSALKAGPTIPMPKVKGRIDHLQYDLAGKRLFISALGNNSVEIIDLKKNIVEASISNINSPQGILFIPEVKKLFVSCGGDGYVRVFNSDNFKQTDSIQVGNDADNMRFDSLSQRIYVVSDVGMTIINLSDLKVLKTIEMDGHPESFQIDNGLRKMYVNVPDANEIEVIDMKSNIVSEKWDLQDAKDNFPMVIDQKEHRVIIACRQPAKIIVMDGKTGNVLSAVFCSGDADDIFYDAASSRILLSCGAGFIDVFNDEGKNVFTQSDHIAARLLARTSFYVPSEKKYFLAVPSNILDAAEVRTYTLIQ